MRRLVMLAVLLLAMSGFCYGNDIDFSPVRKTDTHLIIGSPIGIGGCILVINDKGWGNKGYRACIEEMKVGMNRIPLSFFVKDDGMKFDSSRMDVMNVVIMDGKGVPLAGYVFK